MSLARFLRDGHTHHPEKTALIFGEQTWTLREDFQGHVDDLRRL